MSLSVSKSPSRSWLASLLHEPLLHFLIAAALLLLAFHFFARPELKVSAPMLNGLRKDYEARMGRPATELEIAKIANDYVEDEILYREALRNGLTQDNRVRGMLIQTMRTTLRPILSEPSDTELENLRKETPDVYRFPARVGFEHVSFADAKTIPDGLLEKLRSGEKPSSFGETVQLANPLPPTYRPQLERIFGPAFTIALTKCKEGEWVGPLTSARGVHFVRVQKQEPEREMPLEEIRSTLISKWMSRNEAAAISNKVIELRRSYNVVMPANLSPAP
jgi:hypothetical protein